MKGKIICNILIILLAIVMVLPLSAFAVSAEETPNTNTVPEYIQDIYRNGRTPKEQSEYEEFIRLMKMKEDSSRIDEMFKEKPKGLDKKTCKKITEGIESFRKSLPGLVQSINDAKNGGDFDTASCIDNVISLANTVLIFVPYGDLISPVLDLGNTIFKLAMGGESATSDMAQMEDRLNQQLDDIQNQLSEIEEQINGLSNEINESTNTIINEITSAIDNADAKAYLRTFMLSGEGNFSYNQYRNYIYGASTGNSKANTAYYALLKQSIANDASDEITKYYYDQLYTAIMNDRDVYYDYIMGSDDSKSIVQYYYDVVSIRPDLMNESGTTAEYAAIMFAYDIYQTELMANQIIATCNLYQYAQMCLSGEEYYCYDQSTGKIVTLTDIDGAEGIDSMQEQINIRIDEIHDQLACDIAYILNLDDSYIVKSSDDSLFEVVNSDPDTYGKVLSGQTIYLNSIPEEICDLFGFDVNDFNYVVSVPTHMDGAFLVDSNANQIEATLYYNGEKLDTLFFTVGTNAKFNGGNGTASDPYLIASAAQFASISIGMDKHYRLIRNIDFNGATITPIGQKVNSNDIIVYDEFVGSLDGNGYTISNLNVVGHTNTGLFGIIGETGEIADLKLYNVKVTANITNVEKTTSEFNAGMIAGKNNGIIKYCSVDSDGITNYGKYKNLTISEFEKKEEIPYYAKDWNVIERTLLSNVFYVKDLTAEQVDTEGIKATLKFLNAPYYGLNLIIDNTTHNRNIYAYAGGVAGVNNYAVVGCTVRNNHISASSTHDFGGDKTTTNKNNVYVGGVCGYSHGAIAHSIVKESVKISSYAKSIYNPKTTVNPYVVSHAGGIVAKVNSLIDICQVESSAEIIHNNAYLDCKSSWGEHYKNYSNESGIYIPNYSETVLKSIIATENIEEFIAKTERNYTVTFEFPDTIYEAGTTLTYTFKHQTQEETASGITSDRYICDSLGYTLILSSDQKGLLQDANTSVEFIYSENDDGTIFANGESLTKFNILNLRFVENGSEENRDIVFEVSNSLKTENLKFFINGIEKEYEIVDIYGFDVQNEEFNSVPRNIVVLFSVEIEGETVYFAQDLTVIIEENVVTSIEILNLKDYYFQDTFSPEGLIIKYNYAVGNPEYITINSENISQVRYFGNITTFGTQSIALLYNGNTIEFEINVICGHGNNFTNSESGYAYDESLSKTPSCTEIGYKTYVCGTCGDVQYFYLRKTEHIPDYENAVDPKEATCTEEGNIGKICCVDCGEMLIDGKVIPKLNHHYVYVDGNKHSCSNGSHSEYHHYTVTESVESKINANGSESWYIVYIYTCVCQKDGKVFTKEVVDENLIVDANTKLPTIMVSDGYALSAGGEVVVYVQLLNNPGINAANFGIRYSEGLELIKIQDGNLIKGSLVKDGFWVNYGYNFVWAPDVSSEAPYFNVNGNLLKLTFKVSEYAELGDSYDISLVYAIGNGAQGGFGTSNGKQYFITKDGTIKVVERLPGDINNDGVVDLMDAIEIGKFVVGKTDSIDETYANVDLSYNDDGDSNVDIMDMVVILQYITGGYGTNLLTQDFEIILNTNGYDKVLNDLFVSIYGDNNTYDEAGLAELERQGYKFLGWYDQMVGGNLIDINGDVRYNPNQKKQTLYAHWELNKLVFDANGATSGVMSDVYYTEDSNVTVENSYKKEYNVAFVSDNAQYSNTYDLLKYSLLYWEGSNGKQYINLDAAVKDLMNAHYGSLTLTAVWSETPTLSYPEWAVNGYETTVNWYIGTVSKKEINPGVNDSTILNATITDGYYCVYAKHTPIVYDIVFDFNGGSGTVSGSSDNTTLHGYSVENTYDLARVSVSNVGNAFTSWAVYVDGIYYRDFSGGETISYLPNAKQNSLITVEAIWNEKSYPINYVLNGGNLPDSEKIPTYRISEVDEMKITSPTYPTYSDYNKFVGWYVNKELTQEFDKSTLKANPENITLYAKWDLCTVYYITNTPQKITGSRIIVDWSSVSNGTYNSSRTIYMENVSQIYFVGNPNTIYNNLIISAYAGTATQANQMIQFKNFSMNGYLTKTDNSVNINMTIDCLGNNVIKAPTETSAIFGFNNLYITGNGNISIQGGNGTNGTDGASIDIDGKNNYSKTPGNGTNGTDGSPAVANTKLTINCSGTVTLIGGHGGNGGNGGKITGESNSDGYANLPAGGNGGNGGNGGMPIEISCLTIVNCGEILLQYGNGGNGGNGAMGGNAYEVTDVKPDNGGDGGNGGNGGHGFVAGNGGAGGEGGHSFGAAGGFLGTADYKGTSGDGGDGGDGGNRITAIIYTASSLEAKQGTEGGKAGSYGSKGTIDRGGGVMGKYGIDGENGLAGSIDNTYYNAFENKFSEKLS